MVEIDQLALANQQISQILIVRIVGDIGHMVGADSTEQDIGYRCFPGPGASGDADHQRGCAFGHIGIILEVREE